MNPPSVGHTMADDTNSLDPWELLYQIVSSCDVIISRGEYHDQAAVDELMGSLTALLKIIVSGDLSIFYSLRDEIFRSNKSLFRGRSKFQELITDLSEESLNNLQSALQYFLSQPFTVDKVREILYFFNFNLDLLEKKVDDLDSSEIVGKILKVEDVSKYIYHIKAKSDSSEVSIHRSNLQRVIIEPYEIYHDFGGDRGRHIIGPYINDIIELDKVCILIYLLRSMDRTSWDVLKVYAQNIWSKSLNEHNATVGISKCLNDMGKLFVGPSGWQAKALIGPYTATDTDIAILGVPQIFLEKLLIPHARTRCIADVHGTAPAMLGPFLYNLEDYKEGSTRLFVNYDAGEMAVTNVETRSRNTQQRLAVNAAYEHRGVDIQPLDTEIEVIHFYNEMTYDNYYASVVAKIDDFSKKPQYTVKFSPINGQNFEYTVNEFSVTNVATMVVSAIEWCRTVLVAYGIRMNNNNTLEWILEEVKNYLEDLEEGIAPNDNMEIVIQCAYLITNAIGFKQTCDIGIYPLMTLCACGNELISLASKYNYTALPIVRSMCIDSQNKEEMYRYIFARLLSNVELRIASIFEITGDYIGAALPLNTYNYLWHDNETDADYDLSKFFLSEGFFHGNKSDNICSVSSLGNLVFGLIYVIESKDYNNDSEASRAYGELFTVIKEFSAQNGWGGPSLAEFFFDQSLRDLFVREIRSTMPRMSLDYEVSPNYDDMANWCLSDQLPEQLRTPVSMYYKCAQTIYSLNEILNRMNHDEKIGDLISYLTNIAVETLDYYPIEHNSNIPIYCYIALQITILSTPIDELPSFLQIPNTIGEVFTPYDSSTGDSYFGNSVGTEESAQNTLTLDIPSQNSSKSSNDENETRGRTLDRQSQNSTRTTSRSISRSRSRESPRDPNSTRSKPSRFDKGGGEHSKKTSIKKNKRNKMVMSQKQKKASKVVTKSKTVKHRKHKG